MHSLTLHYRHYGQASRAVLLLHGLFGSSKNWHSQASALSQDYSVYAVDLRNHGQSPHHALMDYANMARDVLELMDRLGLDSADLLGHSMGGKVAMQIALQTPARIDRLIVVDIAPRVYPPHHDDVLEAMRNLNFSTHRTRQSLDEALRSSIPDHGVRQFILTNLVRSKETGLYRWQLNLEAIVNNYHSIAAAPRGELFDKPTLFIKGGASDYITAHDRAAIEAMFPQAQAKVMVNVGHWPHAEKPTTFGRLVSDFLGDDL